MTMTTRLKFLSVFLGMALLLQVPTVLAKGNYIYRHRINWVKLEKLSNKQLGGLELKHPSTHITTEQMVGMLMSIKMDKSSLFKKGIETSEIFSLEEASKYAPLIADGLRKAAPNQVVNLAIVHRRPTLILRNDHLSIINVFVTNDGVHFNFAKLFAKLDGDYQQASNYDEAINNAKSSRVRLSAEAGQTLLSDIDEVVMPPTFAYTATPTTSAATQQLSTTTTLPPVNAGLDMQTPAAQQDIKSRLHALDDLKKNKLVTESEYKQKRSEILGSL